MAIKEINREWSPYVDDYKREFIIDSVDDVANLPTCCTGSAAIVAEKDGAIFVVDASGEWEEL
jgi:hypothetical protein